MRLKKVIELLAKGKIPLRLKKVIELLAKGKIPLRAFSYD